MAASEVPRVLVTGIGLITPHAADREASWAAIRAGRSATAWLDEATGEPRVWEGFLARPAGAPAARLPGACTGSEPVVELARHAAREALEDAGLAVEGELRERTGCVIGTSKGGLRSFGRAVQGTAEAWPWFLPDAAARAVAREQGVRGPVLCPVAACATGLACLIRGVELIREGACDVVLAGSSDASLIPLVLASFQRLGVLAKGFEDPARACRPFDKRRNGFLIGEGAAVLVCERESHARARGKRGYAQWLGSGLAADPSGMTQLDGTGRGLARLIGQTLERAGLGAGDVDYLNLHGTATVPNDACESRAVRQALGRAADGVACSSLKGGLGHLLGAAGSVEMAATLLALRDGVVPPTVNCEERAADCELDCTAGGPRERALRTALKLSLGFGGHLMAAAVARV